jgi:hypothetical protein
LRLYAQSTTEIPVTLSTDEEGRFRFIVRPLIPSEIADSQPRDRTEQEVRGLGLLMAMGKVRDAAAPQEDASEEATKVREEAGARWFMALDEDARANLQAGSRYMHRTNLATISASLVRVEDRQGEVLCRPTGDELQRMISPRDKAVAAVSELANRIRHLSSLDPKALSASVYPSGSGGTAGG